MWCTDGRHLSLALLDKSCHIFPGSLGQRGRAAGSGECVPELSKRLCQYIRLGIGLPIEFGGDISMLLAL